MAFFLKRFNYFSSVCVLLLTVVVSLIIYGILQCLNMDIGLNALIIISSFGISLIILRPLTLVSLLLKSAGVALLANIILTVLPLLALLVLLIAFLLLTEE